MPHDDPVDPPKCVRLRDGRSLAYAQYGDTQGTPVFFFHGLPSCRLLHPYDDVSRALDVRLITTDRPGFGRSDPKPGRTLLDWADDVAELADHLGFEHFAAVGTSGGGPFLAACAYKLGERMTRAAIVGGSGPLDDPTVLAGMARERRIGYGLARHAPFLLRLAIGWRGDPRRNPQRFFDRYTRHNPPADQVILQRPDVRAMFLASYAEATRQGIDAFAHEVELAAKPWGFPLQGIRVPVTLWHGELDNSTPVGMAQAMAAAIPNATLRIIPGEGHLVFLTGWHEIVHDLLRTRETGEN